MLYCDGGGGGGDDVVCVSVHMLLFGLLLNLHNLEFVSFAVKLIAHGRTYRESRE